MSVSSNFERSFLLRTDLPERGRARGTVLEWGFLASDRHREVFVQKMGWHHAMVVADLHGWERKETVTSLSPRQFRAIWPSTSAARIRRVRYALTVDRQTYQLDDYGDSLAPLRLVRMRFASRRACEAFAKPDFLGREVTGRIEFTDTHLAHHGPPVVRDRRCQAGALPFFFKKHELCVVLITSSSGARWIVPKGQIEPRMSRQDVALMEAAEEAGVVGAIEPGHRGSCRLADGRVMHLFPLRVSTLLNQWPEADWRKRTVLPLRKALEEIDDKALAACISRLGARLPE